MSGQDDLLRRVAAIPGRGIVLSQMVLSPERYFIHIRGYVRFEVTALELNLLAGFAYTVNGSIPPVRMAGIGGEVERSGFMCPTCLGGLIPMEYDYPLEESHNTLRLNIGYRCGDCEKLYWLETQIELGGEDGDYGGRYFVRYPAVDQVKVWFTDKTTREYALKWSGGIQENRYRWRNHE